MQSIVDIVSSVTKSVRFVFMLFFLCILGLGLMFTAGATYVAPQAADSFAERAERIGEKAIEAKQREARERMAASEGWGTSSEPVAAPREVDPVMKTSEAEGGGWGQ